MSRFSYPHHCCSLENWKGVRLPLGSCRTARDPDLCEDCEKAKKHYESAIKKAEQITLPTGESK